MVKALLILAWRDDVGAYILHSYPPHLAAVEDIDGQDLMNLYNLHRFRSTDKNFQIVKRGSFNVASFYSGGYQSNYIGKPNYCVTLLLDEKDNPMEYEKTLIKVANNLLSLMDKPDFDLLLEDIYVKLRDKQFSDIKVSHGEFEFEAEVKEESAVKKTRATTQSVSVSEEEKIFADLMQSQDLNIKASDHDTKMADFKKTFSTGDPFSGPAKSADPFGMAAKRDIYAENPFDAAQKPVVEKGFGFDEALGKTMFEKKKSTAAEIVSKLDSLETTKPEKVAEADKEKKFKYLETLVGFLEEKVRILGLLANQVKDIEKSQDEKDQLIGKLLLLLKGK